MKNKNVDIEKIKKSVDYRIINELKNEVGAKDIKIHIYTMPLNDIAEKHDGNGKVVYKLKAKNENNKHIVFCENLIGSFMPIEEWEDEYINYKHDYVDLNSHSEKELLSRLIHEDLLMAGTMCGYRRNRKQGKNTLVSKEPVYRDKNVVGYRAFSFDVRIDKEGSVIIGYESSTSFDYIHTLNIDLLNGTVKEGDRVKDFYTGHTYKFIREADFSLSDSNKYMGKSIIKYYIDKKQENIIKNIKPSTKAVLVNAGDDERPNIFPYIPNKLKKCLPFEKLPDNAKKITKLNATDRMALLAEIMKTIADKSLYVKYSHKNRLLQNLGYRELELETPMLLFNNNKESNNVSRSLLRLGCYENKDIDISYFIDPDILNDKNKNNYNEVLKFTKDLEADSKKAKSPLIRHRADVNFRQIRMDNSDVFEMELRNIVSKYKGASIFVMTDEHINEYYESVKTVFGNKNNLPTQFISLSTIKKANSQSEYNFRKLFYINILLGVYGKSGVQPWVLKENLTADCYVGLDVSRENGVNTAGIVQVVGKDGRVLKTKAITTRQKGEKIKVDTMKEVMLDAVCAYKKAYGEDLKHIVFHRDGINREQLDILKVTANNLNIKFDYIEVTKGVSRRLAKTDMDKLQLNEDNTINKKSLRLRTDIGDCYIKEDYGYLITTDPSRNMGMAQPIRVRTVYGDTPIEDVIKDVYKLTYMHIGSMKKCRLPITTYYADLSSTYGNRGLIPSDMDGEELHFI